LADIEVRGIGSLKDSGEKPEMLHNSLNAYGSYLELPVTNLLVLFVGGGNIG
jgi:hypothetical protein